MIENIWNELSKESKERLIAEYNSLKNNWARGEDRAYELELVFGKDNLNPKPQIRTWKDVANSGYDVKEDFAILKDGSGGDCIWYDASKTCDKIVKKVIAVFKIAKLIELGYGGVITEEEWEDRTIYKYCIIVENGNLIRNVFSSMQHFIAFHTSEQRDEFFKYNEQLVKDYYMI